MRGHRTRWSKHSAKRFDAPELVNPIISAFAKHKTVRGAALSLKLNPVRVHSVLANAGLVKCKHKKRVCPSCRRRFFPSRQRQTYCSIPCTNAAGCRFVVKGSVAEIHLPSGHVALIDTDDLPIARPWVWYDYPSENTRYVFTVIKGSRIQIHRLLLGHPPFEIDHRNGNGLDNRRRNLRPATRTQNNANSQKRTGTTSVFKGVCRHKGAWVANAGSHGTNRYLGRFNSERDAALAYDRAARKLFGEFARLNFPDGNLS